MKIYIEKKKNRTDKENKLTDVDKAIYVIKKLKWKKRKIKWQKFKRKDRGEWKLRIKREEDEGRKRRKIEKDKRKEKINRMKNAMAKKKNEWMLVSWSKKSLLLSSEFSWLTIFLARSLEPIIRLSFAIFVVLPCFFLLLPKSSFLEELGKKVSF